MYRIFKGKSGIGLFLILIFLIMIFGCSEKIINTNSGNDIKVTISAKLSSAMEASALSLFLLTITGPDITEPIIDTMVLEYHFLIARVAVPAGKSRTFKIEAFDDVGTLIYVGVARSDVAPDMVLKLDIVLRPNVPLIKLSPQSKSIHQYSQVVLEIKVYKIPDLKSVDFLLQYSGLIDPYFHIDSIVPNTSINSFIRFDTIKTSIPGQYEFRIYESIHTDVLGIVDISGFARLASIFVSNYSGGNNFDSVSLTIEATAMSNTADASIMPNIYYEGCTIEYYDPYYFQIAYWAMDYDTLPDIMYDWSGNNLHGLAYGAFTVYDSDRGSFARFFDGIDDYIEVPDNNLLDINTEITIDMWVRVNILEGEGILISKSDANGGINYQIRCDVSQLSSRETLTFKYGSTTTTLHAYEVKDFIRDAWHHIVVSFVFGDPTSIYWMIDDLIIAGEWVSGDGHTIPEINDANLQLGRQLPANSDYFDGGLDDIVIYNKALDPSYFNRLVGRKY